MKIFLRSWAFIVLILALFGCSANPLGTNKLKVLHIGVSADDKALLEALRKKLGNNRIKIIENITSDKAIKLLLAGNIDAYIGTLEVPNLYKEEIREEIFARDAIAIVVHPSNKINNLNRNQLIEIFSRQLSNWRTINAVDKPVVVVDRPREDLDRIAIYKNLFGTSDLPINVSIQVNKASEVHDAITKFPNAISFTSFRNLSPQLKALSIDNIPANANNIHKGYYSLSRPVALYAVNNKLGPNQKMDSFMNLLRFLYSAKGQELIPKLAMMPLTEAELQLLKIEEDTVLIGVAAPLEGAYTDLGKSVVDAVSLAADEINELGGINGKHVELIVCNDKAQVSSALDCANKFAKAGVAGVIGHLTSQASIEASKIYVEHGIVQISPASTHPWLTERPGARGFVFRTIGRDDKQAELIAALIKGLKATHPLKVTIFNNNTLYGATLATLVENEINKSAIDKVVEIKAIEENKNQYHGEVASIESHVLVFVGEYGAAAQIVKELALSNKANVIFIGADGVFSGRFIQNAGLRAENAYVTGNCVDKDSEMIKQFVEKFKDKFKSEPSAFSMNSYDAMMILTHAIRNAEQNQDLSINEAVKRTKYQGLTGQIFFNEMGDPVLPRMCIYQVHNGRFVKYE